MGITGIEHAKVVRQIGGHIGAGFVRGLQTTITFDEEEYRGKRNVLIRVRFDRFLGLYSSINSFNQMVLRTQQREEIDKEIPVRGPASKAFIDEK